MSERAEGIRIVRMDDGDFGSERRVEITMDGRTVQIVTATDSHEWTVSLWELGPPGGEYSQGRRLYEADLAHKRTVRR